MLKQCNICKNNFHIPCIKKWLRDNDTCPLCRGLIISLEQQIINDVNAIYNDRINMECTICCQEIENLNPITKLQCVCNYFYHKDCIEKWFNTTLNCPLCRAVVDRAELREANYNPILTIQEWKSVSPAYLPEPEAEPESYLPNMNLNFNHPVSEVVYVYNQNYNFLRLREDFVGIAFSN